MTKVDGNNGPRLQPPVGLNPGDGTQGAQGTSETGGVTGSGALGDSSEAMALLGAGNPFYVATPPTGGLPDPKTAPVNGAALKGAIASMDSSGVFSMMEITALVLQSNKQSRQIMRNDMNAAMEAEDKMTEQVASNMKEIAWTRFTTAVISSAVSIAGSVMQFKTAAKTQKNELTGLMESAPAAQNQAQAYGQVGQAVSGLITAGGELKASSKEAENKLLEAAISRQEKQYQEASSMLGDLRENFTIGRDTLRALNDSAVLGAVARNW